MSDVGTRRFAVSVVAAIVILGALVFQLGFSGSTLVDALVPAFWPLILAYCAYRLWERKYPIEWFVAIAMLAVAGETARKVVQERAEADRAYLNRMVEQSGAPQGLNHRRLCLTL